VCCWGSQGQFVTFSFTTAAGSTTLALRYSAGNGVASRKVEIDGAVLVANQSLPATANWSTWRTVNLTSSLTAGAHTLKVWFDAAAGSQNWINLDNLSVTQSSPPPVPVNTALPTVSGTPQQGQLLTATTGTWTNTPSGYAYSWNRCFATCAAIGVTTGTYTPVGADIGATLTVTVTASNGGGAGAPVTSAPTPVIAAVPAPVLVVAPVVTGTPAQGQQLSVSTGAWTNTPTSFAYSWNRCTGTCAPLGVTTNTYTPVAGDVGATLTVTVTATNGGGTSLPVDTAPTPLISPPSTTATVAVGYSDGATGPVPWLGAPNTVFIGGPAECCMTHGPDNGKAGWDAGAIEVTNNTAGTLTLNAVTVDFGGGSRPSHFDLWSGSGKLPQTVPVGGHVVMTAPADISFDTSDLFGEACNPNSGVVPVVHVTVNGVTTDYLDSHQILNSDGTDLSSCPLSVSEASPFVTLVPGAQPDAPPVNDVLPSTSGSPTVGHVMSGFTGGWNASPPPALASQWMRCDTVGANCGPIGGATNATYRPTDADLGSTLRFQVSGSNATGLLTRASAPSAVVRGGVAQMGNVNTGPTAYFAASATEIGSIFTATTGGSVTDFNFFVRGAGGTQTFTPKIYAVSGGTRGALLATGAAVSVPKGTDGKWYSTPITGVTLTGGTSYYLALLPSGTGNSYVGAQDETNGPFSFYVNYMP